MRRLPILAAALALPATALAQQADSHAIVGAHVVTVSGASYARATIVLRDGLIEAVGPDVTPPPGARVLDGAGLFVTPGLVDGLSAIGLPAPARGGASATGPGAAAAAPLAPQSLAFEHVKAADVAKARDSGITTALVIPKEGVLPGQSAILDLLDDRPEAMVLRQPAALHLHMAALSRQYPGSLMGTMAYVRQALADAARARDAWAAWDRAPRGQKRPTYDAALLPWQEALAGRLPLVVTCYRENDVRRALALADEWKLRVVLANAPRAARLAELLKARRTPLVVGVNFDPPTAARSFGFDLEQERRGIREAEENPAALARAGVAFGLGSAWAPDYVAAIRKAIERGLPAEAALRSATLGAAEALGLADRTGSLEPGKIANVVAWTGEPFAKETKARYVFVDGRLYEPEAKEGGHEGKGEASKGAGVESPATGTGAEATPKADAPPAPLPVSPPAFPAGKTVAIVGGTVLTVSPQGDLPGGTVLVRDGRILAVGRDVAIPEGAVVIDAKGRYVMPGIIDSHSHTAIEGGVNECTDVITAETRIADVIDHRDVSIYRQLAAGVTAINVLHGSCNAIGGQNAVLKLRWGKGPDELVFKEAPRGIKFALGENVKRSNFRVPGREPRYPGSRMGVEVVLREGFLKARAYRKEWAEYEAKRKAAGPKAERPLPPRRDLRLETLADILDGKILVHAHAYRADEMLMLMKVADEFGFKVRTFQHGLECYKIASEIARHGAGVGTFIDWWAFKMEALDATPYNPAVLASHGVRVAVNSDSDELARRLYWDAAKAVKYGGVSEQEALRMLTLNPAWMLGVDRYVGSLETGKQADIAIFSAHPLSAGARCEMTLVDGQVYFDRAKDLATRGAVAEWAPVAASGGAR
ncbi:MAG TPA: amidohydrolase family protein [Vicinamibacteria bacterium]|nr:amidohydrolase family protein [Vicinamibacteria bacterium]